MRQSAALEEYSSQDISIAQWQARPDFALGEQWRSPPMALLVKNDHFQLEIRWSSNPVNTTQNANFLSFDLGPVTHNIWNDWVFHVKWSYDNSGILQVWKNDSLVLQRVNQPIGYNDILFPYLKVGVYKWDWNSPLMTNSIQRTLYIDEVRVGNNLATYYDVAPKEAVMQTLPIKVNTLEVVKNDDGTFTASFVSSKVYEPTEFVLFISEDNGKSYYPTYTKTTIRLEEGKTYKLNFRSR
ncbi:MAG: hypothetical protein EOP48_10290 [Sphingobacteriales bacterium]|nr:MAG: hypothetical protein EOP48_10290 [Sphingobacteriales bacterium]